MIEKLLSIFPEATRSRIANAALWGGLGGIVARGMPLLAMMVAARILGAEGFGRLTVVYGISLSVEVFVTAGLAMTAARYIAELRERDVERAGFLTSLCYGMSLLKTITSLK